MSKARGFAIAIALAVVVAAFAATSVSAQPTYGACATSGCHTATPAFTVQASSVSSNTAGVTYNFTTSGTAPASAYWRLYSGSTIAKSGTGTSATLADLPYEGSYNLYVIEDGTSNFAVTPVVVPAAPPAPPAAAETNPPVSAISVLDGASFIGDKAIKFSSDDGTGSGVAYIYFKIVGSYAHLHRVLGGVAEKNITLWAPAAGSRDVTLQYWSHDKQGNIELPRKEVTITLTNAAPVAAQDDYSCDEGRSLFLEAPGVLTNDVDPGHNAQALLSASLVTQPTNGSVVLQADGRLIYVPNDGFEGTDSFTYRASDGDAASAPQSVSVTVNPASTVVPVTDLLTNEYGQKFAGEAKCVACHGDTYAATTHSRFAKPGALQQGEAAADMYPAGRIGVGESIGSADVAVTLGAGTGLREYLGFRVASNSVFDMLEGMEWDPALPETWELGIGGIERGTYGCGQCHQVGWVAKGQKPKTGTRFASVSTSPTLNGWAKSPTKAADDPTLYNDGMSIQCERCHGTGVATGDNLAAGVGHWDSGVKIVGFNSLTMSRTAKAASTRVLNSDVCGQCHGRVPGANGNILGYTPDQRLSDYLKLYTLDDVPTAEEFAANPDAYAFYPSGQNKSNKHSYYNEWAISGHSWRGALSPTDPDATPYQQTGAGHFNSDTKASCNRCHTGEGYLARKDAYIMKNWVESTENAGQLGQECAICHVSHDENGNGMMVRQPDAAGEGSNAGLTTANNSICEDCHNWQYEVEGYVRPNPATLTKATRISHPQREIYNGRGFYGVDEADAGQQYMPGAKCEDCHMPATYSDFPSKTGAARYEDRSWKRYSHRMFIMEPGDAAEWELPGWGDSCTPCHNDPDRTQADLQADLDERRAMVAASADAAKAALASARTRAGSVGTPATDALIGRANVNVLLFDNDGSAGFHNPDYVMAGMEAAANYSKAVGGSFNHLGATASSVANGGLVGITANIKNGDGTFAQGAEVRVIKNGVVLDDVLVSTINGNVTFWDNPTANATYQFKWVPCDDPAADVFSASKAVSVSGAVVPVDGSSVERISGGDRYAVAVNVAEKLRAARGTAFKEIIVASGEDRAMADPLGAAALASAYDAPVLLSQSSVANANLIAEIRKLRDLNGGSIAVRIVGGPVSVSDSVKAAIDSANGAAGVERISGADRYSLAANIATRVKSVLAAKGQSVNGALLVNIDSPASFNDALAVSSISAYSKMPLIGVQANAIPGSASAALAQFNGKPVYAVNSAYVSAAVRSAAGVDGIMASSTNREVAAVQIANFAIARDLASPANIGLVNALSDALPAGAFISQLPGGGVMVYTPASALSATTAGFLPTVDCDKGWVFGGTVTITSGTQTSFTNLLK